MAQQHYIPGVTIVIPVYNRAGVLRRTLDSVADQSYRPLHVILVDNNSTDDSLAIMTQWQQAHAAPDFDIKVISELTPGAPAARNTGLSQVTTEWTMFFDSDDVMLPSHVAQAMTTADAHPDADVIGWSYLRIYADGHKSKSQFTTRDMCYANLHHSIFSTQLYMARTDLFRRVGGWRKGLGFGDDMELGNRLLASNPRCVVSSGPNTVIVHESPRSLTNCGSNRFSQLQALAGNLKEYLPHKRHHWVDLYLIVIGSIWAKDDPATRPAIDAIISATPYPRRLLWRLLYRHARHGLPGAMLIYKYLRYLGI